METSLFKYNFGKGEKEAANKYSSLSLGSKSCVLRNNYSQITIF
jgi:hypothetical protein